MHYCDITHQKKCIVKVLCCCFADVCSSNGERAKKVGENWLRFLFSKEKVCGYTLELGLAEVWLLFSRLIRAN